jgi:methionyl aminopeptidase
MSINNEKDLKGILKVGNFVGRVRDLLLSSAKVGMTTLELDLIAKKVFKREGALSAPMNDYKFPGYTCISVNEEIAHGIPSSKRILRQGDLINVDVSAKLDGYYADTGISFLIGETPNVKLKKLCEVAIESTEAAIRHARTGNYLRHLGREIHHSAMENGFNVVKNLAGHGTGRKLHEEPQVLVYEDKRVQQKLTKGLVLAIESFISTGSQVAVEMEDGWTLATHDKSYVAQCEHTIIVMDDRAIVATK